MCSFKNAVLKPAYPIITLLLAFVLSTTQFSFAQLPPHFYDIPVVTGMKKVEGVVFDHNHRMYAWEKGGKVWIIDTNGVVNPGAVINISPEVGDWVDHGLNGVVLDPDFEHNGYIYLDYTVDRHYLLNFGTPLYNKDSDEFHNATIARVTRYKLNSANNFNSVVPGSRFILIGSSKTNGIPVTHLSHASCGLVFGTDGTLLIPTGDGAAYGVLDNGDTAVSYANQALLDSIITSDYMVGAFKSQMVTCLSGKILRIDPMTGNGIPSNPYYDPLHPAAPESRVWCLGLRNPYKVCVRPGSGSTNPADGKPGIIYIGDVGWDKWEDLKIVTEPKQNFGWPIFEGLDYQLDYKKALTQNYLAPNPLYGIGTCTQQFFNFQDLLMQATLDSTKEFQNPCDTSQNVPATIYTFKHTRPALAYRHHIHTAEVGIYNGNDAVSIAINDSLSPCKGELFGGDCIIGGSFYSTGAFPAAFQNKYYMGEFEDGWIKRIALDTNDSPIFADPFADDRGEYSIVHIVQHPTDGSLIYVKYPDEIRKICYACLPDMPPIAVASADTIYGGDTLLVNFSGSNSHDPDNSPLTYSWNFGDGFSSTLMNPQHVFGTTPGSLTIFTVLLTVTDDSSHSANDTLLIELNNTPPHVLITSVSNGDFYSASDSTLLPLAALVTDAEQGTNELFYKWQVTLNLNGVDSIIVTDTNKISNVSIQPFSCVIETSYYIISLTVTDIYGLSATDQDTIYPDCNAPVAVFSWLNTALCENDSVYYTNKTLHFPTTLQWTFTGGTPTTSTLTSPSVYYAVAGNYEVTLLATNDFGTSAFTDTIVINSLPLVSINTVADTVCLQSAPINLTGNPTGGSFSGLGVTDSVFYPDSAGIGQHKIYYSYTNISGCSNSDSISISVDACLAIEVNGSSEMIIYPNPVHDKLFIQKKSVNTKFHLTIRDLNGKSMFEKSFNNKKTIEEISVEKFAKGIYMIEVISVTKTSSYKIVIE